MCAKSRAQRAQHAPQDVAEFLEAVVLRATSPEEAFQRLDTLADRHVERLRRVKKQIADARTAMDAEAAKHYLAVNATLLEKYVPGTVVLYLNCKVVRTSFHTLRSGHGHGVHLLGAGQLCQGAADPQPGSRILLRIRRLEAQHGPLPVHAGMSSVKRLPRQGHVSVHPSN